MRASSIYKRHGISQAQIASIVGASQGQVSRLLGGKVNRASKLFEEICLYAGHLAPSVIPIGCTAIPGMRNIPRKKLFEFLR